MPSWSAISSAGIQPASSHDPSSRGTAAWFFSIGVGAERAGDRFQDVGWRYDTFEVAVLVMDQDHRHFGVTQQLKRIERIGSVGNDGSFADMRPDIERLDPTAAPPAVPASSPRR